jgi:hypothetical protein
MTTSCPPLLCCPSTNFQVFTRYQKEQTSKATADTPTPCTGLFSSSSKQDTLPHTLTHPLTHSPLSTTASGTSLWLQSRKLACALNLQRSARSVGVTAGVTSVSYHQIMNCNRIPIGHIQVYTSTSTHTHTNGTHTYVVAHTHRDGTQGGC